MAEFQEVMHNLGRICANNLGECNICDLRPFCPFRTFIDKYEKSVRAEQLEKMVMSWAAAHPEPVYPTFGEWLEKQGIVKLVNSDRYEEDGRKVYILLESVDNQIPADIAVKLEIEPKEGKNHDD